MSYFNLETNESLVLVSMVWERCNLAHQLLKTQLQLITQKA